MSEIISLTCPSCSTELEMEVSHYKSMEGQTIDCPACDVAITIPSLTAPKPTIPRCPDCHVEMAGNAVICTACGLDLRTGQKLSLEPERKSRLGFKRQESMPVEQLSPALARFQMPVVKPPTFFEKIIPALKAVALLVIIAVSALVFFTFIDVPALLKKNKGSASNENSQKKIEQVTEKSPVAAKIPETRVATKIIHILERLRSKTTDKDSLQQLMDQIMVITDSNENRLIKCGIKTVFAFGQLQSGNEQVGLSCCDHILKYYSDVEFAGMVNKTNFYVSCPKCSSQGEIHNKCASCQGNMRCRTCGGEGFVPKVVSAGLGRKSASPDTATHHHNYWYDNYWYGIRSRTVGKSASPVRRLGEPMVSENKTVQEPCKTCKGTSRCSACNGAGFLGVKCTNCNSTGKLFSNEKSSVQYSMAITRILSLLEQRQQQGKDIIVIESAKLDDKGEDASENSIKETSDSSAQQK